MADLIGIPLAALNALISVAGFFILATLVSLITSLPLRWIKTNPAMPWQNAFFLSLVFSFFAAALGFFVGITAKSGSVIWATVLGAMGTLLTTYLSSTANAQNPDNVKIYGPSLLAFYVTLPLTIEYWQFYHAS